MNTGNRRYWLSWFSSLCKRLLADSELIYQELRSGNPKQRQSDITLAKEQLDCKPSIQLTEGLKETITYFRDLHQN